MRLVVFILSRPALLQQGRAEGLTSPITLLPCLGSPFLSSNAGRHVSRLFQLCVLILRSLATDRRRFPFARQTGVSDIPLTANGEKVMKNNAPLIVGPGSTLPFQTAPSQGQSPD